MGSNHRPPCRALCRETVRLGGVYLSYRSTNAKNPLERRFLPICGFRVPLGADC